MPNDPVPQNVRFARHQPAKQAVTPYDLIQVQKQLEEVVRKLQDQLNAIEARVGALE